MRFNFDEEEEDGEDSVNGLCFNWELLLFLFSSYDLLFNSDFGVLLSFSSDNTPFFILENYSNSSTS